MAVLLQFNMAKQHAVEYLQEATQLQADVLRQVLQILIRIKLLVSLGSKVKGQKVVMLSVPLPFNVCCLVSCHTRYARMTLSSLPPLSDCTRDTKSGCGLS